MQFESNSCIRTCSLHHGRRELARNVSRRPTGKWDAWQGSVAGREVLTARRGIYRKVTLFAGHVVFDEVGMLETHEFDGEAIFDMADNAALRLADRYDDADGRAEIGR
jgi:hypothetical protein